MAETTTGMTETSVKVGPQGQWSSRRRSANSRRAPPPAPMRGGRLLRGPKRRQQLLACLFASATDLGANTAVLMVIGVPLTLVTA
jgi:hypothetical protein